MRYVDRMTREIIGRIDIVSQRVTDLRLFVNSIEARVATLEDVERERSKANLETLLAKSGDKGE